VLSMVCTVCYLLVVYCLPSFGGVKCYLWCVLYVFNGVYCMLSIGVVFRVFWWCKVLSMVCAVS
jgi:hypothetical protein